MIPPRAARRVAAAAYSDKLIVMYAPRLNLRRLAAIAWALSGASDHADGFHHGGVLRLPGLGMVEWLLEMPPMPAPIGLLQLRRYGFDQMGLSISDALDGSGGKGSGTWTAQCPSCGDWGHRVYLEPGPPPLGLTIYCSRRCCAQVGGECVWDARAVALPAAEAIVSGVKSMDELAGLAVGAAVCLEVRDRTRPRVWAPKYDAQTRDVLERCAYELLAHQDGYISR